MVKSKSIRSDQNHFGPTKTVLVTQKDKALKVVKSHKKIETYKLQEATGFDCLFSRICIFNHKYCGQTCKSDFIFHFFTQKKFTTWVITQELETVAQTLKDVSYLGFFTFYPFLASACCVAQSQILGNRLWIGISTGLSTSSN